MSETSTSSTPLAISSKLFFPGVGAGFFLFLVACFFFWRPELLLGDGSTCRHLDAGTYILTQHQIHTTNYTSALFPDVKAISASFLGDVLFALSYQIAKLNGLVCVAAITIALTLTWSYQFARARGLGPVIALFVLILAMTAASMHWSARTLVYSHLLFLVLYYLTFMAVLSPQKRIWLSALTMLVWVNFHGSFLLGMVMLAARTVGDFIQPPPATEQGLSVGQTSLQPLKWNLITIALCAVMICINPNGPSFYSYVTGYLSHPMIMTKSNEWKAIDFGMGLQTWAFLALYALIVFLWTYSRARPKLSEFILVNFLFFGGLYTMRLEPYFALIAMPSMAYPWSVLSDQILAENEKELTWLPRFIASWFAFEKRIDGQERAGALPTPVPLAIAAVMAVAFLFVPQLQVKDFDPAKLPVASTSYIIDKKLDGLGFCYDNWGGYLYWRLKRPIFIDDWTDFYPVGFTQEYIQTMMAQPGWQQTLDKYKVQYVIIPHSVALGVALSGSPDWKMVFADPASEIYCRRRDL